MFRKPRRRVLKRAIEKAGDPELRELQEEISERQDRIAQLEFELMDTRTRLARFEREFEAQVGVLYTNLENLEQRLAAARHAVSRRAQWGDRVDTPDSPVDVVSQFQKTWTPRERPPAPPPPRPLDDDTKAKLKSLFRDLAKRFHPDLVTDSEEKAWREKIMSEVNQAYASNDLDTLQSLAEKPDFPETSKVKSREAIFADIRAEIKRLDSVILSLQARLKQLINSQTVQLMLEASISRRSGRDLLAEMAKDLRVQIAEMESELAALS